MLLKESLTDTVKSFKGQEFLTQFQAFMFVI